MNPIIKCLLMLLMVSPFVLFMVKGLYGYLDEIQGCCYKLVRKKVGEFSIKNNTIRGGLVQGIVILGKPSYVSTLERVGFRLLG